MRRHDLRRYSVPRLYATALTMSINVWTFEGFTICVSIVCAETTALSAWSSVIQVHITCHRIRYISNKNSCVRRDTTRKLIWISKSTRVYSAAILGSGTDAANKRVMIRMPWKFETNAIRYVCCCCCCCRWWLWLWAQFFFLNLLTEISTLVCLNGLFRDNAMSRRRRIGS